MLNPVQFPNQQNTVAGSTPQMGGTTAMPSSGGSCPGGSCPMHPSGMMAAPSAGVGMAPGGRPAY